MQSVFPRPVSFLALRSGSPSVRFLISPPTLQALVGEKACYQSVCSYGGQVVYLGTKVIPFLCGSDVKTPQQGIHKLITHTHTETYAHTDHINIRSHTYSRGHTQMHTRTDHTHTYGAMHMNTHTHRDTHTHIYTYTQNYTHTHKR